MTKTDVIIIGASASGLMCAIEAGRRQRSVLLLDHANKAGKKILMSGGGRCNFTNLDISAENYLSDNPHFCKSALSRYTQWDFIARVEQNNIAYHQRDHGQLFCDDSAKDILTMLLNDVHAAGASIKLNTDIISITQNNDAQSFLIRTSKGEFECASLVIATGGLSIPKMCASPFGYRIAEQFGHSIIATSAGLVPFTLHDEDKARFSELSGIAVMCEVSNQGMTFRENILFTHRGLSGPAMLQLSNYWIPGETIEVNLLPDIDLTASLLDAQKHHPKLKLKNHLATLLPKRLISAIITESDLLDLSLHSLNHKQLISIAQGFQQWRIKPNGTEGYRTAEVTRGGVNCNELSSKTMASNKAKNLYFIGEVVDVTGWLGGYNFQWAWSSGWVAGQYV